MNPRSRWLLVTRLVCMPLNRLWLMNRLGRPETCPSWRRKEVCSWKEHSLRGGLCKGWRQRSRAVHEDDTWLLGSSQQLKLMSYLYNYVYINARRLTYLFAGRINCVEASTRLILLPPPMDKIKHKILVLSGKGGVGKSTVATQVAMLLAMKGLKVWHSMFHLLIPGWITRCRPLWSIYTHHAWFARHQRIPECTSVCFLAHTWSQPTGKSFQLFPKTFQRCMSCL